MYTNLIIFAVNIIYCYCYVAYEMFQGFDFNHTSTANLLFTTNNTTISVVTNSTPNFMETRTTEKIISNLTSNSIKFNCKEEEKPANIGPYEIPTQRDVVLLIKKTLISMFNRYHEKAMYLLMDIRQATRATGEVAAKCQDTRNRVSYKKCVKRISNKCEIVTKSLVTSLERQKEDVSAFTEVSICKINNEKMNPIQLVKILAMEEATLEFALPGFLRLLHKCSVYCSNFPSIKIQRKPHRHMTDQDLVINHFLTKKNYIQLIKGTK